MNILVAPNSFKNSLDATAVAEALIEGLLQSFPKANITKFPVADGGDGTAPLLMKYLNAQPISITVQGPLGEQVTAEYGWIEPSKTAIIEMAAASGLRLIADSARDPLHASSFGTGELILHALNQQAKTILLCIGGSATVDGGSGILQALGFRFLNKDDQAITAMPQRLEALHKIDTSNTNVQLHNCEIKILCDVNNYLLGNEGAAKVFGPQKGADASAVLKLENALEHFSNITLQQSGKDMRAYRHGGAAGGTAAGLAAWLNASLLNGTDEFLSITAFDDQLRLADLVITGEGSLDEQTLQGKAPFGVALRSQQLNIPVIGIAGKVPLQNPELQNLFNVLLSIGNEPTGLEQAMIDTKANLIRTGRNIGALLAIGKNL
ncbi:glycerate kinase [Pseudoflavitalea sp. G-6-1-2]|uniref:glycerate kinase n=1 Tax=Pseudoflavitalea sp. G-6-1-2 TaxID=2728841 RepID=UPI00146E9FB9|nr:glycerate kinase [Pseudoflavitalea sp. G-6-1-2]NML19730.1 glycerate kinase [Pseudoflavitalea sp. G-6-1-2]